MVKGTVQASCDMQKWSTINEETETEYSAEGVTIKASGTVRITQDCPRGLHALDVAFPVVSLLIEETNTTPEVIRANNTWGWEPVQASFDPRSHHMYVQTFRAEPSALGCFTGEVKDDYKHVLSGDKYYGGP